MKITELKNTIHHLEKCVAWYRAESARYRELFLTIRGVCLDALTRAQEVRREEG